jgi:hypothetical protein
MSRPVTNLVFAAAFASAFGMAAAAQTPERIPLLRDISPEAITIAVYYKENVSTIPPTKRSAGSSIS